MFILRDAAKRNAQRKVKALPGPAVGAQVQEQKGGSVVFTDYQGRNHSQVIYTSGGIASLTDIQGLAQKMALCSNACYSKYVAFENIQVKDADLRFYDEAEASVSQVLVIVAEHDTTPALNRRLEIPAYDASLLLSDMRTPDKENAKLLDVVNAFLAICNDDDDAINPDDYHSWRAYTTTRKQTGNRGTVRSLPAPSEPGQADNPPPEPGETA